MNFAFADTNISLLEKEIDIAQMAPQQITTASVLSTAMNRLQQLEKENRQLQQHHELLQKNFDDLKLENQMLRKSLEYPAASHAKAMPPVIASLDDLHQTVAILFGMS